jgi:hypothetical protein
MTIPEDWQRTVAEWRASGLTAEQFGQERGLPKTRLWAWSSRARQAERCAARPEDVRLAQVIRQGHRVENGASVTIEVGEARIDVRPGVDRATLTTVLEVLGGVMRAKGAWR